MDNFFLFSKHLNDEGCFCLKLDESGALSAPPAQRPFAEIKTLQQNCQTVVVEPCDNASLLDLELQWLPERKARTAIPYALEDKLAQSVDELHFAFDKARYQNGHYLISAIAKQRMQYLIQTLTEQDIEFTAITLDWFALEADELCVTESTLLINMNDFKGALSGELAETFLKKHIAHHPLLFVDSQINSNSDIPKSQESSYLWIAQRLLKTKILNLCQGEYQHGGQSDWIKKGYQLAGALFGAWLIALVTVNAINLHFINKQTSQIDEQIAVIYKDFFPNAKQVISPKFRISQLLQSDTNEKQNRFWFLLNQFSKAMETGKFTLEQIHYQNKILMVTLTSTDFANLEQLENKLKTLQLNVKQTQASTKEQQVVATLELS